MCVDAGSAAFSVSSALVLIKLCASRSVGRGQPYFVPLPLATRWLCRRTTHLDHRPPARATSPKPAERETLNEMYQQGSSFFTKIEVLRALIGEGDNRSFKFFLSF